MALQLDSPLSPAPPGARLSAEAAALRRALLALGLSLMALAPDPGAARGKVIGVSVLIFQHQFFQDLRAGMEQRAREVGHDLWVTSDEFDPAGRPTSTSSSPARWTPSCSRPATR